MAGLLPSTGDNIWSCDIRNIVESIIGNGVTTGMAVSQKGTGANMSVDVASGTYIAGNTKVIKGSTTNVIITAAHATNDRYDLIIGDNAGNITVVTGTAAAPGTEKPPEKTADKHMFGLVWVEHTVASILDAAITDKRIFVNGLFRSSSILTASDVLSMVSAKITNVTDPTANQDAATKKYVDDVEHDTLVGLANDDHTQYYNNARHTKTVHDALAVDHGALSGKGDDDHTQYYNNARHTKTVHDSLNINADQVDGVDLPTLISNVLTDHTKTVHDTLGLDHGNLSGKGDDDHPQYYNSARHNKTVHDVLAMDHGSLTGLGDNDHTQYINFDGTDWMILYDHFTRTNNTRNWTETITGNGNVSNDQGETVVRAFVTGAAGSRARVTALDGFKVGDITRAVLIMRMKFRVGVNLPGDRYNDLIGFYGIGYGMCLAVTNTTGQVKSLNYTPGNIAPVGTYEYGEDTWHIVRFELSFDPTQALDIYIDDVLEFTNNSYIATNIIYTPLIHAATASGDSTSTDNSTYVDWVKFRLTE